MALLIGNGYFSSYIDSDRIYDIYAHDTPPVMSLWERIKDFFLGHELTAALDCLHKLCHPSIHYTSVYIEDLFFKLKELASEGHKKKFCHNHIYSSCTSKLHIKDNWGNDLLCIKQYGMLSNYTIMGKHFSFYNESIPFSPPRFRPDELPISITLNKEIPQLKEDEQWMRNGVLCLSSKKDILSLDFREFSNEVISTVKLICGNSHVDEWKQQEKITFWSAIANKIIDENVIEMEMPLSNTERKDIFNIIQDKLDIKHVTLDVICAQSSIKHVVLTMLRKKKEVIDFIDGVSACKNEVNKVMSEVVNVISFHLYEEIFKEDGDLVFLAQQVKDIHAAVEVGLRGKRNDQLTGFYL